jgi:hypothetical protein
MLSVGTRLAYTILPGYRFRQGAFIGKRPQSNDQKGADRLIYFEMPVAQVYAQFILE